MSNFEMAKKNFERGLWTCDMLSTLVKRGKLTVSEFKEITGKDFE